jgi:putative oxidoreductase
MMGRFSLYTVHIKINTYHMMRRDIFVLVARLIIGGILIYAGWLKVSQMTETIASFQDMGFNNIIAYAVSYGELVGGIALVLGLYMELAAVLLAVIMAGAVWVTREGGLMTFGYPLSVFAALLALAAAGSGSYTIRFGR